jgi:ATP-binding cassette, subfamily B, bacterial PglK
LSFFEVLGIGLIAPYIALITNTESEVLSNFFLFLDFPLEKNILIVYASVGLLLVFLIKTIMIIYINKIIIVFGISQRINLSSFLMKAYQSLPYEEFLIRNSSEYIHNIQTLTSIFSTILIVLLRTISELLIGISILVLLAWQNPTILTILLFVISAFVFTYDFWFKDKVKAYGENTNNSSDMMIKEVNEGIKGLKEIRVLGKESYFYERFVENVNVFARNTTTFQVISSIPRYLLELIMVVFIVSIVLSTILLNQNLNEIVPTLGLFGIAALRLLPLSNRFLQTVLQVRNHENSIDRLYNDVNKFEHFENNFDRKLYSKNLDIFESLKLEKINFSYASSKRKSLRNVSFEIKKGESIGVIGKSGSGKTTLIDLLLGLLKPNSGKILLNGTNITNELDALNGRVAYIPQQPFLLDNSLMSNISLNTREHTNEMHLLAVIKQARLNELVDRLPNGLDTKIGESGARISGGERQRIALARAFYFDRDIIVMDEATSSLDRATEQEIMHEIKNLKGVKTLIIIAHRLETIAHCDNIYKLDNGENLETGSYEDLVK